MVVELYAQRTDAALAPIIIERVPHNGRELVLVPPLTLIPVRSSARGGPGSHAVWKVDDPETGLHAFGYSREMLEAAVKYELWRRWETFVTGRLGYFAGALTPRLQQEVRALRRRVHEDRTARRPVQAARLETW
jgi:hypothetical protein